jgi:hypothetical protein
VWSAGINATELAGVSELATGRSRRLPTDERLRLAGRREAFAIGDLASVHVDGQELPMLAPPAMQEGRYVASAIVADVCGGAAPGPFRYRNRGTMAVIGRNAAVASLWRLQLTGLLGWKLPGLLGPLAAEFAQRECDHVENHRGGDPACPVPPVPEVHQPQPERRQQESADGDHQHPDPCHG